MSRRKTFCPNGLETPAARGAATVYVAALRYDFDRLRDDELTDVAWMRPLCGASATQRRWGRRSPELQLPGEKDGYSPSAEALCARQGLDGHEKAAAHYLATNRFHEAAGGARRSSRREHVVHDEHVCS